MSRLALFVSLALLSPWICALANAQCVASSEVKTTVEAYSAEGERMAAPEAERKSAQKKILDQALADHPTDPFLLDRKRDWFDNGTAAGQEAAVAFFLGLHEKYPDAAAVTGLYGNVLERRNSAQALKVLEAAEKAHPSEPWIHYELLGLYIDGKTGNLPRLAEEIDAYLKLCPASNSPFAYRMLASGGTNEQIVRYARLLRTRLEGEAVEPNQGLWSALWNLEFKAAKPDHHPAVRARIQKDLARFETLPDGGKEKWLSFLLNGYTLAGDNAAIERTENRILEKFPDSSDAEKIVTRNWESEHPFPKDGDHAAQQAWCRLSAVAEHEWYERFHDLIRLWREFDATADLDETTPEQLLAIARKYVAAYHENPNSFYAEFPMEFDVADALIKKKALPTEIPAWVDEGFQRENNRPSRLLGMPRDELTDEMKKMADRQTASMRMNRARILLDYYDALGQPAKAAGIEDQLAGVKPADERMKPELYEVQAHAALMQNRKLDALLYYRAGRDLGGKQGYGGVTDAAELDKKVDALYAELGGTPATLGLFTNKATLAPLSSVSWETPKNPLPSFNLTDLGGKTWSAADLKGVATLVNVWATWCGPCRMEHPELEKLYQKVRDRKNIAILSVNVDEQAGLVAPYMTEHKYTFPVLLGKQFVHSETGEMGIPQNWLISPSGKLETIQLGYGDDPRWPDIIFSRLQEMTAK